MEYRKPVRNVAPHTRSHEGPNIGKGSGLVSGHRETFLEDCPTELFDLWNV